MKNKFLLFFLFISLQQLKAQFCFNPKTAYPVGIYPSSLCYADFNKDGKTDLAVANRAGTVSILLGDGNGSFDTAAYFNVGYLPYSICTADFNNDSIPDLATANRGPWDISVIFGDGTGSFGTDSTIGASNPRAIVATDFNHDGNMDLAIAHYCALLIVLGNGAGGFSAPSLVSVSNGISALTAADFNGDTIPDLVAANTYNVSLLIGNGSGGFAAPNNFTIDTSPVAIISSDFNHDGKMDIATCNMKNNVNGNISILLGNGAGSFGASNNFKIDTAMVPQSLCSGDFDNDGQLDLAIAGVESNSTAHVFLMRGDGTGSFGTAQSFVVDSFPNSIISNDFNGDGKTDLALVAVFTNNDTGYVDVLLNCNTNEVNELPEGGYPISIYPNPGSDIFHVQFAEDVTNERSEIEVFNLLGKRVYSSVYAIVQKVGEIDLSKETAGIYSVRVKSGDKTSTGKICKQ